MAMTPEFADVWLQLARKFAMALVGVVGLTILLWKYSTTGDISLPAFAAFSGLLGLNALSLGRGSNP